MTTVSRFSHQNDVGLHALNVVLRENFVLVVVLVLESKFSNDLVDLANVTQASRVIRGSDEARARCLRSETALLISDMANA